MSLAHQHDPGGKVRIQLRLGVTGSAVFSPCGRYRQRLDRRWADAGPIMACCGMNPSVAAEDVDDPTVRIVCGVAVRYGCAGIIMLNAADYRATHPTDLAQRGVKPRSDANLPAIHAAMQEANASGGFALVAWGAMADFFQPMAGEALKTILATGIPTYCLGRTKNGSPRHPLYVRRDKEREPYP